MSLSSPDSQEFGMAVADYWKIIAEAHDDRRRTIFSARGGGSEYAQRHVAGHARVVGMLLYRLACTGTVDGYGWPAAHQADQRAGSRRL